MTAKLLNIKITTYGIMVLLLALFGLSNRAQAQVTYATVHGTVTDTTGAVCPQCYSHCHQYQYGY